MSASRSITVGMLLTLWGAGFVAAVALVVKDAQKADSGPQEPGRHPEARVPPPPKAPAPPRPDAGPPREAAPPLTASITVDAFPPAKTQLVRSVGHLLRGAHSVEGPEALDALEAADGGAAQMQKVDVKHHYAHLEFHEQLPGTYTLCVVSTPGKGTLFGCAAATVTGMIPVVDVKLRLKAEAPPPKKP